MAAAPEMIKAQGQLVYTKSTLFKISIAVIVYTLIRISLLYTLPDATDLLKIPQNTSHFGGVGRHQDMLNRLM